MIFTGRIRVEKEHRRSGHSVEHVFVQSHRTSRANGHERVGPDGGRHDRQQSQYGENRTTRLSRNRPLQPHRYRGRFAVCYTRGVFSCSTENVFLQVYPKQIHMDVEFAVQIHRITIRRDIHSHDNQINRTMPLEWY